MVALADSASIYHQCRYCSNWKYFPDLWDYSSPYWCSVIEVPFYWSAFSCSTMITATRFWLLVIVQYAWLESLLNAWLYQIAMRFYSLDRMSWYTIGGFFPIMEIGLNYSFLVGEYLKIFNYWVIFRTTIIIGLVNIASRNFHQS